MHSCSVEPGSGNHATTLSDTARSQWTPDLVHFRFSSLVCHGCPPSYPSPALLEFLFLPPSPLPALPVLDPPFSFWPSSFSSHSFFIFFFLCLCPSKAVSFPEWLFLSISSASLILPPTPSLTHFSHISFLGNSLREVGEINCKRLAFFFTHKFLLIATEEKSSLRKRKNPNKSIIWTDILFF